MPKDDLVAPYLTGDGRKRLAPMSSISAADRLIKKKQAVFEKGGSGDLWEVVDEVLLVWKELRPKEYESSIIAMDFTRESLDDKEFASAKRTKGSGDLRRTIDVPVFFETVLRRIFTIDELPYNKKWYEKLWKRYPAMRVSEKI